MPIILPHLHRHPWRPVLAWPDDCAIQWDGHGVVLGPAGGYRTAFFEAFPKDGSGGFIRGEGENLEAAEANAHATWSRQLACHQDGGHRWRRTRRLQNGKTLTYQNGGCFCLRCKAFQTVMKPIVRLGEWRTPLPPESLDLLMMGSAWAGDTRDEKERRYARRLELRARLAGISIPDSTQYPGDEEAYTQACEIAVARAYAERVGIFAHTPDKATDANADGLQGLFRRMSEETLREAAIRHGFLPPESPEACESTGRPASAAPRTDV